MSSSGAHHQDSGSSGRDRLLDLLADRAVGALSPRDEAELQTLLTAHPDLAGDDSMDWAAAALDQVFAAASRQQSEPLPADVRARIRATHGGTASLRLATETGGASQYRPAEPRLAAWTGWVAAAACLLLAISAWWPRLQKQTPVVSGDSLSALRDDLLQHAPDPIVATLTATEDPAVMPDVTGEVLWSDSRQEGVLSITGLRPNDPAQSQYQLWIFDKSQPSETPIDGGVFDVKDEGETLVPITAKLPVRGPFMFAITVEKPGGVVVTDRTRIALIGQSPALVSQTRLAELQAEITTADLAAVRASWQSTTKVDSSVVGAVSGNVVWSNSRQEGVLQVKGLAVNNPALEQYQLWIFDRNQSDKTPVDGGVFNVTADGGVFVPIDAKLEVKDAFMFAITVEKPGGVVVSDRSRLALIAEAGL